MLASGAQDGTVCVWEASSGRLLQQMQAHEAVLAKKDAQLAELAPGDLQYSFFCNSGTEAVMNGIKAARAATGRAKIAKCENAYHGSYDAAEISLAVTPTNLDHGDPVAKAYSFGTPQGVLDDIVIIPFNGVAVNVHFHPANHFS